LAWNKTFVPYTFKSCFKYRVFNRVKYRYLNNWIFTVRRRAFLNVDTTWVQYSFIYYFYLSLININPFLNSWSTWSEPVWTPATSGVHIHESLQETCRIYKEHYRLHYIHFNLTCLLFSFIVCWNTMFGILCSFFTVWKRVSLNCCLPLLRSSWVIPWPYWQIRVYKF